VGTPGVATIKPPVAAIPSASCTLVDTTRTCELWAKTGTIDLPGSSGITTLGFAPSAGTEPQVPGPTIKANPGETLVVTLHNTLAETVSLAFPGQALAPDTAGAPAGGDATYTLALDGSGTFLYEAGLTPNGPRQVAMGLYGALVVGGPPPGVDKDSLVVFGGIDPQSNNAWPAGSLNDYEPDYWVINGRSYPDTESIDVRPGDTLLLRYINAGLGEESMGVLGLRQTVVAMDGTPLAWPMDVVAETVPAGGTMEAIVEIPASAAVGDRYALGSGHGHIFNGPSGPDGLPMGGLLTFITVVPEPVVVSTDTQSPLVGRLAVGITQATPRVVVATTADDRGHGGSAIRGAEWFIGADPGAGLATPMIADDGSFDGQFERIRGEAPVSMLRPGRHVIGVRAVDAAGNWAALGTSWIAIPDTRLKDDFESGTLAAWSATRGTSQLAVRAAGALEGRRSLNITVRGAAAAYLVDASPSAWTVYRAQFAFQPRGTSTGGRAMDLFVGRAASGAVAFRIQYRRTSAGLLQVRAVSRIGAADRAGGWVTIANRTHQLDVTWRASATGGVTLLVDGRSRSAVNGDNRAVRLDDVRLGAIAGMSAGSTGRLVVDAFVSARDTIVAPLWPAPFTRLGPE
jgi:hypothetical protein